MPGCFIKMERVPTDDWLHTASCQCPLCCRTHQPILDYPPSDRGYPNQLQQLLSTLPVGFPIWVEQTVVIGQHDMRVYATQMREEKGTQVPYLTSHPLKNIQSLSTVNLHLYWRNQERIITKFQAGPAMTERPLYAQPYQHRPIIRVQYSLEQSPLDGILKEFLQHQQEHFREKYRLNEQFMQWVWRQYGEDIFFHFITDLYARLYFHLTRSKILSGVFLWTMESEASSMRVIQKTTNPRDSYNRMLALGRPRKLPFKPKLLNLRNLSLQHFQHLYSFDQEYKHLIKQKIQKTTKKHIAAIKNPLYKERLQKFRDKIHHVYDSEQNAILSSIKPERTFNFEVDSQIMAQKLIPNLKPGQNLRDVLNDQAAFREVFKAQLKKAHGTPSPKKNLRATRIRTEPKQSSILSTPSPLPRHKRARNYLLTTT